MENNLEYLDTSSEEKILKWIESYIQAVKEFFAGNFTGAPPSIPKNVGRITSYSGSCFLIRGEIYPIY